MPVPPSNPQDMHTVINVLIAIVVGYALVAYWRTALRLILVIVIALTVYGAVAGVHGVTTLMVAHHQ
jgi:ABC-type glycerol-3-phosphate transport system permease component